MKHLLTVLAILALAAGASAQDPQPPVSLTLNLAAGAGFDFGEEDAAFSTESLYATIQANAVEFDLFNATSGVGLEVGFSDEIRYSLWSLNRADVPGVPGAYGGADLKVAQNGPAGLEGNFDARIVTGYKFGKVGPGDVRVEFYAIEENNPIRVAFLYGWK